MISPKIQEIILSGECPECQSRRRRECSAIIEIAFTLEWVYRLAVDCNNSADHELTLSGAWTNPIIKLALAQIGLTKRSILATARRESIQQALPVRRLHLVR